MGGPSYDTRKDIYRVDRQRVKLLFLAGQRLEPRPRTNYALSHDIVLDGDKIIYRMYGSNDVVVRNNRTGEIIFDHCGWPTIESMKVLDPLMRHYFGNTWTLQRKGEGRGQHRGRAAEMHIVPHKDLAVPGSLELDNKVTFRPLGGTMWEVTDGSNTFRFDMRRLP